MSDYATHVRHRRGIVVVDFGSQYTQLIARRVRELETWCEILSWRADDEAFKADEPAGIILSGGPESATQDQSAAIPGAVTTGLYLKMIGSWASDRN